MADIKQFDTKEGIREEVKSLKRSGKRVGFVPTMGAMHEGHLSLMRLAREHADEVVVSIYVNPTQFGPDEDFEAYPRRIQTDIEKCENEGVYAVFTPTDKEMYLPERYLSIKIDEMADYMCGAHREGHFEGVLLIVNKLFNVVQPDVAAFGQKDIQQYALIHRMVREFDHDVELLMGPIKRADDGLALSSRNSYLTDEQRVQAPSLYRALGYVKKQIEDGVHQPNLLIGHQRDELEAKDFEIDYFGVYDFNTLKPVDTLEEGKTYTLAIAAYLGSTRLIDNMLIEL